MDESLVSAILEDWRSAPIEPRLGAALAYIEKLVQSPDAVNRKDIVDMHDAGLSDGAIAEAAYVVFLFSVMDRLADAFDFHIPSTEHVRATGRFLAKIGYTASKKIR